MEPFTDNERDNGLYFEICVIGEAQTQGSKRSFMNPKTKRFIMVEDNPNVKSWRQDITTAMAENRPGAPIDSAVKMRLTVYVTRPKGHYNSGGQLKPNAPEYPPSGKDLDKIQRAIGDAATGIWLTNDARIAWWEARRRYVEPGDVPKVIVSVETLGDVVLIGKPRGENSHVQKRSGNSSRDRDSAGSLF
jgi:Holliday junction resolvase RusA-like endonuclease